MRPVYSVAAAVMVVLMVILCIQYYTMPGAFMQRYCTLQTQLQGIGSRDRILAPERRPTTPHLVVVACGKKRFDEAMTTLKSAVMFTKEFLAIHVITDSAVQQEHVKKEVESWPIDVKTSIKFNILNATFPANKPCPDCQRLKWKSLFQPCAAQRLFLADVLPDVDSVIYVDADTLFLAPIEELWSVFSKFNSTQLLGVGLDSDVPNIGAYYGRKDKIPIYGHSGINSGVLLMNLTRIRTSNWIRMMAKYYIKYDKRLLLGDNDLINIYLHDHPERGYRITCDWNYHKWQCIRCDQANITGVALLHSTAKAFLTDAIPTFRAVYRAFKQFKLGNHTFESNLLPSIVRNLDESRTQKPSTRNACHKNQWVYTKRIKDLISQR